MTAADCKEVERKQQEEGAKFNGAESRGTWIIF